MPFSRLADFQFACDQVGVTLSDGPYGAHTAIAYWPDSKRPIRFLHFLGHEIVKSNLTHELAGRRWMACKVEIPNLACKQLVAIVRAIARNPPKVKYGVNLAAARGSFVQGAYAPPPESDGLTCASFVSEIFRDAALSLVDETTWPATIENLHWGNIVYKALKKQGINEQHLETVRASNFALRLTPFEVAAAGDAPVSWRPLDFARAGPAAGQVVASWDRICPMSIFERIQQALGKQP